MGEKRELNLTDEERQRRSELAKQLHAQVVDPDTGQRAFGGRQPGAGRPRKIRAAELVAEEAKKSASDIVAALKRSIDPKQPASIQLQGARQWLEIENKEAALQLQEEKEYHKFSDEELAYQLAQKFMELNAKGALDGAISEMSDGEIIEGDFVDVD